MYVIMVYDVEVCRVYKVLKVARKYLTWIQNSVLEGEITSANFERLKSEILKIIDKDKDSVIFYKLRDPKCILKEKIGLTKNEPGQFI